MRKSLLNLCLQKVAEGDETFFDRLCQQLADRLVFAPIVSAGEAGSEGQLTFSIVRMQEGHRLVVPLFTSEELYKAWEKATAHKGGSISLLGADFCAAVDEQTWLRIDPGSTCCVELQPVLVKKVASVGVEEPEVPQRLEPPASITELSEEAVVESPASTPSAAKQAQPQSSKLLRQALFQNEDPSENFQSAKEIMQRAEPVVPPMTTEPSEAKTGHLASAAIFQEPAKVGEARPKIIRSKGTGETITAEVERPRSNTSTTMNRPVIRSSALQSPAAAAPQPEDARGKKKSFLKFLKGS